jgi:hypothetical protein
MFNNLVFYGKFNINPLIKTLRQIIANEKSNLNVINIKYIKFMKQLHIIQFDLNTIIF